MPSTNTITAFNTFAALTKIKSAEVNNNFDVFRGNIIPVHPSTATAGTTGTYNLGSSDYTWLGGYLNNTFLAEYDTTTSAPTPPNGFRSIFVTQDDVVYTKDDSGTAQIFQTGPEGGLSYSTITSAYTATSSDNVLFCNASTASFNISLFTASSSDGQLIRFINEGDTLAAVNIVATTATGLINNTTTISMFTKNELFELISENSKWRILKHETPKYVYSFTPTLNNITVGNGSVTGYWFRDRHLMKGYITFDYNSTSTITGSVSLTVPNSQNIDVSYKPPNLSSKIGDVLFDDNGSGVNIGYLYVATTLTGSIVVGNASSTYLTASFISSSVPFAWTTNDGLHIDFEIPIDGWREVGE